MNTQIQEAGDRKVKTVSRGPQKRAEETRESLIALAIERFSTLGYDGVSVRALESDAGVQRGAVAYHFDTKETLWKRAVDRIAEQFATHFAPLEPIIRDLEVEDGLRAGIAAFVRFSAEQPELNRLMVQEGRHDSWRLTYIVDAFVAQRHEWFEDVFEMLSDPHTYYIMIGSASFVFDVEHECRRLFGVDPTSDEFIREHAARVADMMITARRDSNPSKG